MDRIQSVDVFRLAAIIAVIAIHTTPFYPDLPRDDASYRYLYLAINQSARFAVPFFFVISGYFWGIKVRHNGDPLPAAHDMAKRVGVIFIAWCLIYLLPYELPRIHEPGYLGPVKAAYWHLHHLAQDPVKLLMQGTKVHLWFLVTLILSVYIAALFIHKRFIKSLVAVAVALYVIGLLAKAYADTPLGIELDFNTRNGPFFGLLLFVGGYLLSGIEKRNHWLGYGLALACLGLVLHLSEVYLLWSCCGTNPKQDYVIGTALAGIGVAMMALSDHRHLRQPALGGIGRMTLGIYVVHFVYVDLFRGIDAASDHPAWEIGYVFLVLALSVISVALLSRHPTLRKIVA